MKSDNLEPVRPWRTYADEEWARITWDPLTVDDEPWPDISVELLDSEPRPAIDWARIATILTIIGLLVLLTIAWWDK